MKTLDRLTLYNGSPIHLDLSMVIAVTVQTSSISDMQGNITGHENHTKLYVSDTLSFPVIENIDLVVEMVKSAKEEEVK